MIKIINSTSIKKKKYNNGQISCSQNKNESSNLNLYYNTSSHIKSKFNNPCIYLNE